MLRVFGADGMYLVQTEHLTNPSQPSAFVVSLAQTLYRSGRVFNVCRTGNTEKWPWSDGVVTAGFA
jgi:hypothetical protein